MHIEKYTKLKNGQYKLNFDDDSNCLLHEDLILKYNLLINKEVSKENLQQLQEENLSYVAYGLALDYLKIKMRSKKEIKEYLLKKEVKETLIDDAINILTNQGYLNDESYCKAFINDKINLTSDGPYKIKENLIKLGIKEDIINNKIETFTKELELERIDKLINKLVKANHNKSEYALKRKIVEHLTILGYTKSLVISEVEKINIEDDDIKEKEYKKIYDKLSKKYTGKELEYKIKQKLYQKGFNI